MQKKAAIIENPALLKLELLSKGVRLDKSALKSEEIAQALEIGNRVSVPLELDMILPGNVLVNIAVQECLDKDSCYVLKNDNGEFYITNGVAKTRVWIVPPPKFYNQTTSSGALLAKIGRTYGNYLLITPSGACEFLSRDMACKYCDVEAKQTPDKSIDDVLETVEAALKEGAAEYICFNIGYADSEDGGIKQLLPYIKAVKDSFNALICIQAQPPASDEWVDMTYAAGVDSLAYNLEVFDPEIFGLIAPGKKRLVGRDRYFKALARAAKVFPSGAVVSNLIIGLEPVESTLKGIDALAAFGVVPTLPLFRPLPNGELTSYVKLSPEAIAPIFIHLEAALNKNKLSSSWINHFNIVVNAIDAHLFGGQTPVKKNWPSIFSAKKHNKLALNLRRRLRVRATDNNEPTGL